MSCFSVAANITCTTGVKPNGPKQARRAPCADNLVPWPHLHPPVITNAHILARLRHLLESGELQRELDHVGYHCISFDNVYGVYRYEMDVYRYEIE